MSADGHFIRFQAGEPRALQPVQAGEESVWNWDSGRKSYGDSGEYILSICSFIVARHS